MAYLDTNISASPQVQTLEAEDMAIEEVNVQEYETRLEQEVEKYYISPPARSSSPAEVSNLSMGEKSDLMSIDNVYGYLTPSNVVTETDTLSLVGQGEALWDSSRYNSVYNDSLSVLGEDERSISGVQETNPLESLNSLSVSFVEDQPLVPADGVEACYVLAEDILQEGTKFSTENLFTFESLPSLSETELMDAESIALSLSTLLGTDSENKTTYEVNSIEIGQFDLANSKNTVDNNFRTPSSPSISEIPVQIKSLMLGRSSSTKKNWLDSDSDPATDPETAAMIQFNYFEIQEVQVLEKFNDDTKSPTFKKMTKEMLEALKKNGGVYICRLYPYDMSKVVPQAKRSLGLKTYNQYFVIDSGKGKVKKRPGRVALSGATQFGGQVFAYLLAGNFEVDLVSEETQEEQGSNVAGGLSDTQSSALSAGATSLSSALVTSDVSGLAAVDEQQALLSSNSINNSPLFRSTEEESMTNQDFIQTTQYGTI